jgi:shikimate dehydrogenase
MNQVKGTSRVCGLIGNPVEHTMSPAIHNHLAERTGTDLVYVPFHVETGRLEDAVKGAFALNLLGLNVTVPYKSDAIPFLSDIDPLAKKIGAVNTLVRTEDGYKGYNTDMPGLYRAMQSEGVKIKDEDVLILGAGGVARAVAMMLAEYGAASITLINRSTDKAEDLADEVNRVCGRMVARALSLPDVNRLPDRKYLVIQATSVGMSPNTDACVIEAPAFFERVGTGYDLIFNPAETKFMKLCKAAGANAYNGLRMLLYQGIIAYELWTGSSVSEELALETYDVLQKSMGR